VGAGMAVVQGMFVRLHVVTLALLVILVVPVVSVMDIMIGINLEKSIFKVGHFAQPFD
jgi:hypothetical protein